MFPQQYRAEPALVSTRQAASGKPS